jgi:RNA polymerase sigma factor (sigma-70 family)
MKKLEKDNTVQVEKDKACVIAMQSSNKAKAQDAFNQIYKRYKSPIFYEVLRMVKMNKETATDLSQEIFVKVWEKIGSYDFSVAFSTWMYNVAKNHVIDHKRKQKVEVLSMETLRSEFGGDEDVNEVSFQLEDKSADTFSGIVREERANMVLDALNNGIKSEDAKDIIALIFMKELSYEEVAQVKKMPLGTIKAIMYRAKTEMKEYLSVKKPEFEYGRICTTKLKVVEQVEEEVED